MKNKVFILDTSFSRENGLSQGVNTTMRYLIDNRQIALSPMDLNTLYQTKLLSMSPTNRIFEHILADGLMDEYAIIDTSQSTQSTPELLTIPDICIDMKQFANAGMVFSSLKEYRNKIIINIAPLIQRTREGFIKLTDVNELHSQVVRGALVSSYYNCNDNLWLTPNLLKYIAQSYSMCLAGQLQRLYNLDIPSQMTISAALTWFMMTKMTDDADELTVQCEYLGGRLAIRNMIDMFKDSIDDITQFDLVKVCNLIASVGPDHMKGFNKDILIKAIGRMGASHISMYMALEYPPYWVYQILYALSGNKVYLSNLLQKNKLLKSAGDFLQNLDTCRQFVPSVAFVTKGHSSFDSEKTISFNKEICKYDASKCGYSFNKNNVKYTFEALTPEFGINNHQKKAFKNLKNILDINTDSTLHLLYKYGAKDLTVEEAQKKHCFSLNTLRISQDGTTTLKYAFVYGKFKKSLVQIVKDDYKSIKVLEDDNTNFNNVFSTLEIDTLSTENVKPSNESKEKIDIFKGYTEGTESITATIVGLLIASAVASVVSAGGSYIVNKIKSKLDENAAKKLEAKLNNYISKYADKLNDAYNGYKTNIAKLKQVFDNMVKIPHVKKDTDQKNSFDLNKVMTLKEFKTMVAKEIDYYFETYLTNKSNAHLRNPFDGDKLILSLGMQGFEIDYDDSIANDIPKYLKKIYSLQTSFNKSNKYVAIGYWDDDEKPDFEDWIADDLTPWMYIHAWSGLTLNDVKEIHDTVNNIKNAIN